HEDTVNEAAVNSGNVGLHCLSCLDNSVLSVVQFNECSDNKSLNMTSALDCNAVVTCSTVSGVHASNHG
ncbi:hypothetical protein ACS4Y4_30730, partial [Escherichia coli]|uniref:hypothetical protein n=1 Tax=Escherichia coli TaxID=562 RepID=UPI003F42B008